MNERKIKLELNTAITGINPETGKWDEKAHNTTVMPLRGLIMQVDGASGCYIARYAIEVNYLDGVTDAQTVTEAVQAAVREVTNREGFFPLRGDKTPTATPPAPAEPTYNTWWVAKVTFGTDLFANKDEETTKSLVAELAARLANADGARQPGVNQRLLYVRFDRRQVEPEKLVAHVKSVVDQIMEERQEKGYFPFADPEFTFEAHATPYVI